MRNFLEKSFYQYLHFVDTSVHMKRFVKKGRRSNPNLFFNSMVLELAVIKKLAMNSKILTSTVENFNLSI